jgi:hypothetical protein
MAMAERCRERVRLLVVILPTKVAAMWARLGEVEAQRLRDAEADERAIHTRLVGALTDAIPVVDVLPDLRGASDQPFPENGDGHPNPAGHRIIAARVAAHQ